MARQRAATAVKKERRQGTVQVCQFALDIHRETSRLLMENKKVVATAAVLAFSRMTRDQQISACEEVRRSHITKAGA